MYVCLCKRLYMYIYNVIVCKCYETFMKQTPILGTGGFKFYSPVSHGRCNLAARRSRPSWWHPRFEGQRRAGLSNDTAESMGFQEGDLGSAIAGATSSSCNSKIFQARRAWTRASVSSLPRLFFLKWSIFISVKICQGINFPGGSASVVAILVGTWQSGLVLAAVFSQVMSEHRQIILGKQHILPQSYLQYIAMSILGGVSRLRPCHRRIAKLKFCCNCNCLRLGSHPSLVMCSAWKLSIRGWAVAFPAEKSPWGKEWWRWSFVD